MSTCNLRPMLVILFYHGTEWSGDDPATGSGNGVFLGLCGIMAPRDNGGADVPPRNAMELMHAAHRY